MFNEGDWIHLYGGLSGLIMIVIFWCVLIHLVFYRQTIKSCIAMLILITGPMACVVAIFYMTASATLGGMESSALINHLVRTLLIGGGLSLACMIPPFGYIIRSKSKPVMIIGAIGIWTLCTLYGLFDEHTLLFFSYPG